MKKLFLLLLLITSLPLMAVLPPLGNSLRELRALVQDQKFYQALNSADIIEVIEKTENGYLITTSTGKQIAVGVIYHPVPGRLGPAPFELTYEAVGVQ